MIITPLQISRPLGFTNNWFQSRFGRLALDYVKDRNTQYRIEDCIQLAENYKSTSKNQKQNAKSEIMMKQCLAYMKGLQNAKTTN